MNIIITGAGKGIGAALTLLFAKNGHSVCICSRTELDLIALKNHYTNHIQYFVGDLSLQEVVNEFHDFCKVQFEDKFDVLINNAGVFFPGQIHSEDEGVLTQMWNLNVMSAYHLTRKVVPSMISNKNGHIFMMNSTASITPYANGGSYCVTKYALHGMTKVLREELKPFGIKVTSVMPGATLTNSWSGTTLPEDRFMEANDVALMIYQATQLSPQAVIEEILMRPILGDL
jgi:short-subunit dehydrogenase